jgi:hypothetical protein
MMIHILLTIAFLIMAALIYSLEKRVNRLHVLIAQMNRASVTELEFFRAFVQDMAIGLSTVVKTDRQVRPFHSIMDSITDDIETGKRVMLDHKTGGEVIS